MSVEGPDGPRRNLSHPLVTRHDGAEGKLFGFVSADRNQHYSGCAKATKVICHLRHICSHWNLPGPFCGYETWRF